MQPEGGHANFTNSKIHSFFGCERTPLNGGGEAEEASAVVEWQAGVEHVPRLHSRHAHQRRHAPHFAVTDLGRLGETWSDEGGGAKHIEREAIAVSECQPSRASGSPVVPDV